MSNWTYLVDFLDFKSGVTFFVCKVLTIGIKYVRNTETNIITHFGEFHPSRMSFYKKKKLVPVPFLLEKKVWASKFFQVSVAPPPNSFAGYAHAWKSTIFETSHSVRVSWSGAPVCHRHHPSATDKMEDINECWVETQNLQCFFFFLIYSASLYS